MPYDETDFGDFRFPVTLFERIDAPNSAGGVSETRVCPLKVWADVQSVGTAVYIEGQQTDQSQITHRIIMRYHDTLGLYEGFERTLVFPGRSQTDTFQLRRWATTDRELMFAVAEVTLVNTVRHEA